MRSGYSPAAVFVAVIALLVGLAACGDESAQPRAASAPEPASDPFILAADEHGAIVYDLRHEVVLGYDRAGVRVWRDEAMARNGYITCLRTCPDAVASGSLASESVDARQDTIVRTGKQVRTHGVRHADLVLLARDAENRVVLERRPNRSVLVSYHLGREVQRVPVADTGIPLVSTATTDGITVTSHGPSNTSIHLVRRDRSGWAITQVESADAQGGCVTRSAYALVHADRVSVVNPSGDLRTFAEPDPGMCRIAEGGLLTLSMSIGTDGRKARVHYWDLESGHDWTVRAADRIGADLAPSGDRVVLVEGTAATVRTASGTKSIRNVVDARYAGDGSLVLLHPDGTVSRR